MDRIEKDFKDLDFDAVDFDSGHWSFGRGGAPLKDHEWFVVHVSSGFEETRYKAPAFINRMLDMRYLNGKQSALDKINAALKGR